VDPALLALGREAMVLALLVSGPPLLAALLVGAATGLLQAATQVQEPTVAVVPRIAAVRGTTPTAGSCTWVAAWRTPTTRPTARADSSGGAETSRATARASRPRAMRAASTGPPQGR